MTTFVAFAAGLLFGIGLILAGMADPAKVLAFLDIAGRWDPSLALVMAGAIGVAALPFHLARQRSRALLGTPMNLPQRREIDAPLVAGSLLFGIGWGLVGFCPGPAVVAAGMLHPKAWLFVAAMLAGSAAHDAWFQRRHPGAAILSDS